MKLFLEQAQAHADWIFYFGPGLIWLLHFFRQSARITALTFSIIGPWWSSLSFWSAREKR